MEWDIYKSIIFQGVTGSRLYGTNRPDSDTDIRGVCIPPLNVLLDPLHNFEQKDSGWEDGSEDKTIYSLKKFFELCGNANPNIIELLFIPFTRTLSTSKAWGAILENKDLFVSKKARYTFAGYAKSQYNDIKRHRQWFINPPKKQPKREDFGLKGSPTISKAWLDAIRATNDFSIIKPEFIEEVKAEFSYHAACVAWSNYVQWRDNRNPARKALEEKYGYDVKHGLHLYRLVLEAEELLTTGKITFPLPQAEELVSILHGKYTYDELMEKFKNVDKDFDNFCQNSTLPREPNWKGIRELYIDLLTERYHL